MSNSAIIIILFIDFFLCVLCARWQTYVYTLCIWATMHTHVCAHLFSVSFKLINVRTEKRWKKANDYVVSKECWTVGGIISLIFFFFFISSMKRDIHFECTLDTIDDYGAHLSPFICNEFFEILYFILLMQYKRCNRTFAWWIKFHY